MNAFADDKIKEVKMRSVFDIEVENLVEKGENIGKQNMYFLLFKRLLFQGC